MDSLSPSRQSRSVLGPIAASIYAYSVLLFAMVGNAQIMGLDLVLTFMGPPCLLLLFITNPTFSQRGLTVALIVCAFSYALLLRSSQFDMLLGHSLWPVKAALLSLFAIQAAPQLRTGQVHLIAALVFVLIATSLDQNGRQYGLFGPNMLYRFYGLLILASLFMFTVPRGHRLVWLVYMSIGLAGIFQTGSVGALILVVVGGALFLKPSLRSFMAFAFALAVLVISWGWLQQFVVVERLLLKMTSESVENSQRIQGTIQIFEEGIALFGHSYEALGHVWTAGYDYPHNIFVELLAFYGFLGIPLVIVLLAAMGIVWRRIRRKSANLFDLIFVPLFVGSQFSGDLSDNYGVVGLAVAIVSARSTRFLSASKKRQLTGDIG